MGRPPGAARTATDGVQRSRQRRRPTTLASFNGSNGANPRGSLTLIGSTLYGTTENGGGDGFGTVFSVPISGGAPTTLASFNGSNGLFPCSGLTLNGVTIYGTTLGGGVNDDGTVFALSLPATTQAQWNVAGSGNWSPNGNWSNSLGNDPPAFLATRATRLPSATSSAAIRRR